MKQFKKFDCVQFDNSIDFNVNLLEKLTTYSIQKGSHDNHSAILISFINQQILHENFHLKYKVKEFVAGKISSKAIKSSMFIKEYKNNAITYGNYQQTQLDQLIQNSTVKHSNSCVIS